MLKPTAIILMVLSLTTGCDRSDEAPEPPPPQVGVAPTQPLNPSGPGQQARRQRRPPGDQSGEEAERGGSSQQPVTKPHARPGVGAAHSSVA